MQSTGTEMRTETRGAFDGVENLWNEWWNERVSREQINQEAYENSELTRVRREATAKKKKKSQTTNQGHHDLQKMSS